MEELAGGKRTDAETAIRQARAPLVRHGRLDEEWTAQNRLQ
jgi:hypothetical protein